MEEAIPMSEYLQAMIQHYKQLSIHSPMNVQKSTFDSEKKTVKVESKTYYQLCYEQIIHEDNLERMHEEDDFMRYGKTTSMMKPRVGLFEDSSAHGRAMARAQVMVNQVKTQLLNSIISSVNAFLKAQMHKLTEEQRETLPYKDCSIEWAEQTLYVLGIVSLRVTGDYAPMLFGDKILGLKKTTTEVRQDEEQERENEEEEQ